MENNIKVAVAGSGYWGKNLVRNFYNLNVLSAVVDSNIKTLNQLKENYSGVITETSYENILKNNEIQGIVLATPAVSHYNMAKQAILAGKHVFVEKPIALKAKEAKDLISLAENNNKIIMVDHLLQQHSAVKKLKELINIGYLGKIEHIYSRRMNFGKLRTEENVLWSLAPHDVALITSLLNENAKSVSAFGRCLLSNKIVDMADLFLHFHSGVSAQISVSWLNPIKEQKLVVVGQNKMAVFDDTLDWINKLKIYPHEILWKNNIPEAIKNKAESIELEEIEPLKLQCLDFLHAIKTGVKPLTHAKEGLEVIKILEAAQKSILTGVMEKTETGEDEYFVHESSFVDDKVKIGKGSKIWHFSHILTNSQIGENCSFGQNVVVGPKVKIGNNCKIQNNVSIYEGVELEDDVFCGPSMVFTNVINPRAHIVRKNEYLYTLVRKGASIGANATIVCGNSIGRYAFIAAGALVCTNVLHHALMVGVPAKRTAWLCKCGVKLKDDLKCNICGLKYKETDEGLLDI